MIRPSRAHAESGDTKALYALIVPARIPTCLTDDRQGRVETAIAPEHGFANIVSYLLRQDLFLTRCSGEVFDQMRVDEFGWRTLAEEASQLLMIGLNEASRR